MVIRRPTSSQFKKTSRRMRRATIESQLPSEPSPISSRKGFSNARRARTARRGEIRQVLPQTSTRESRREYQARMVQRDYLQRSVSAGRRRKAVLGIGLAMLVLAVACFAAAFVYVGNIDSRLLVSDDGALSKALALPSEAQEGAQYAVLAANFDDPGSIEAAALVRTDTESGRATIVSIPGSVLVSNEKGTLSDAYSREGDAGVVQSVEDLAGVQIAHYARIDAAGLVNLVDILGGITVTLDSEVRDPDAGDLVLPRGTQAVDGNQALFLCRANDYDQPDEGRAAHMALVAAGLLSKATSLEGMDFYLRMDEIADCLKTDMNARSLKGYIESLGGVDLGSVMSGAMPTSVSSEDGREVLSVEQDAWKAMMDRVKQGLTPKEDLADVIASVDAGSFDITVNNGGGIEGAASQAAQILQGSGFRVASVGNTSMQVYDETLVIYKDEAFAQQADAVVALLGCGRPVWDSVHYSFDTDVLVVIGSDWAPAGGDPSGGGAPEANPA